MAKVSHKVALSFRDGPLVTLPDNLLATGENGTQYLKLRASSPVITKLLAGHLENFKTLCKPSLAGSKQFFKLKEMFDTVLHGANGPEENQSMFGEGAESQEGGKKGNRQIWQMPPKQWLWPWKGKMWFASHHLLSGRRMFVWLWMRHSWLQFFLFCKEIAMKPCLERRGNIEEQVLFPRKLFQGMKLSRKVLNNPWMDLRDSWACPLLVPKRWCLVACALFPTFF